LQDCLGIHPNVEKKISEICLDLKECAFYVTVEFDKCQLCKGCLDPKNNAYYQAVIYHLAKQPENCLIESKQCTFCNSKFFPSYWYESSNNKRFYQAAYSRDFINFTRETVFECRLLKNLDYDILYKQSSFDGFCSAYNALNSKCNAGRLSLQPRRIAEVWFHYHLLQYSETFDVSTFKFQNMENLGISFY
jgi:hypothetical protein